ncbi:hypothetical protein BDZ89DRAFT_1166750 [Hymenopellis radicata]|nr:hypothetical protein BDZ89DRAFT_1166750 [Hymenopellis radicata]
MRTSLLPPRRQAMPGRVGHKRVEFSQDDKEHLGQYLASRVPKPADGGLLGKVLYNELVDLYTVDPTEYAWVKRHTAQSWREHYKKNPAYFNAFIIDYVAEYGPNHDRNRYFRTRELNRGIKRSHSDDDDEQDEEEKPEHIPTQNWRGKRAAREEEERRQRSIARRQEAEEDSEEDVAPPARPKNATPGPSGTNRHFSEGMTTLVASPEKTQIITSQTPPGSPVHSPEPKRERSPSLHPPPSVIEVIDIESEPETPPRPKPKPKADGKRRAKTPVPIVAESDQTKAPTPGEQADPVIVESAQGEQPVPKPEPTIKGKARSTGTPVRKTRTPDVAPTAPYRNTRSRSRSVEPAALPPPKRRRVNKKPDLQAVKEQGDEEIRETSVEPVVPPEPKKRRGNKKQAAEEQQEDEEMRDEGFEPVVQPQPKEQRVDKVVEGLEDEQDDEEMKKGLGRAEDEEDEEEKIEDLLRSEDPNNFISDAPRARKSQPSFMDYEPDHPGPQMYDSLDEDDHQTRVALFSEDDDDDDDEEESQEPLFTQKEESQMEVDEEKVQEKPPSTQPLGDSLNKFNSRRAKKTPVTPPRQVRLRRKSTESSEQFPLDGTGAGRKLKEMQNIGKVTPYVPPSGSRAAKHLFCSGLREEIVDRSFWVLESGRDRLCCMYT